MKQDWQYQLKIMHAVMVPALFLYSIILSLSKPEDMPQNIKTNMTRQPHFQYAVFVGKSVV